jgi:hypothetical protein
MRSCLLLAVCCCYCLAALARQPDSLLFRQKMSPHLLATARINLTGSLTFWIVTTDSKAFKAFLTARQLPVEVTGAYPPSGLLVIRTSRKTLQNSLLPHPSVVFADQPRQPREEQAISSLDPTANQLNTAHFQYPAINGEGLVVSVKENKPDTTDIDFRGRFLSTPLSSPAITAHAGVMTTMIAGGGNTDYTGKGAAWGATFSSSDFTSLLPDANSAYQQYHISVQNHSYGTGIENYYGADAAAYDASAMDNPTLLHVFSAGNAGNQVSASGAYTGIPGYANITGSFKMGKNLLTVGATNGSYVIEALSSRGPAYDGRLKPELAAFGEDGSSGAAAIVSGIALLVQQAYQEQNTVLPPAYLVKAILLNTADDIDTPGIDVRSGYGSVNSVKALQTVQENRFNTNNLVQNQMREIPLTVPAGIRQLKVTVCWYDPPATPNAAKALVNDLDLELVNNTTGEHWLPWVLNTAAHIDSLQQLPVRKRDSLNNNEQVTLDNPLPGAYTIRIKGYRINAGIQSYALTWQADTLDHFRWYYPTRADNVFSGQRNTFRWASTFNKDVPGLIEYTTDGAHWQIITSEADAAKGFYYWQTPDTFTTARLRFTTGNHVMLSDTFTISTRLKATTGFNCPDSFLLTWNRPKGVNRFAVYTLGNQYLSPLLTTADTNLVLSKQGHATQHYTVAPLLANNFEGTIAFTFNYTTQGVECFIRNFLADLQDNTKANLQIELGTLYSIQTITVEKRGSAGYSPLQSITPVTSLQYILTDNTLTRGANIYRLKMIRSDGSVIYSQPETVFYFGKDNYIIYPNPVNNTGLLQVLSATPGNSHFTLYNSSGLLVLQKPLPDLQETIPLAGLRSGLYFYVIRKEGKKEQVGKVVVY